MFKIAQALMSKIQEASDVLSKSKSLGGYGLGVPSNFTSYFGNMPGATDLGLQTYFKGVGKQESGMNYGAVNKMSGALGKYQFMPNTLKGMGINPTGFLNNPQLQEQAMQKFTMQNVDMANKKGFNININDGVDAREGRILAGMHYGGTGFLNKLKSGMGLDGTQSGGFPSFNNYTNSVLRNMWN